jgi:ribosome-binding protein aMBF1 (putative translation factor)
VTSTQTVREAREAVGISQADMPRRVGVRVGVLRDHEKGRTAPDLGRLRRYAEALRKDLALVDHRSD